MDYSLKSNKQQVISGLPSVKREPGMLSSKHKSTWPGAQRNFIIEEGSE